MRKFIRNGLILLVAAGCLGSPNRRSNNNVDAKRGAAVTDQAGSVIPQSLGITGSTSGSTSSTSSSSDTMQPVATVTATSNSGFDHCDVNNQAYIETSLEIGRLRLCRHKTIDTRFRVKFDQPHLQRPVCFIPTRKDSDGNSIYIGSALCTYNEAGQVLEGNLLKNRPGYAGVPLNGIMIMMQDRVPSFYNCMDAEAAPEFQDVNSPFYGQSMTYLCGLFTDSGGYIDVSISGI